MDSPLAVYGQQQALEQTHSAMLYIGSFFEATDWWVLCIESMLMHPVVIAIATGFLHLVLTCVRTLGACQPVSSISVKEGCLGSQILVIDTQLLVYESTSST